MRLISRKEALALGLNRYFSDKICRGGHLAERQVSTGRCIVCKREANYAWRKKNKKSHSLTTVNWRRRNAARINRQKLERRKRALVALRALEELGIEF